jgi:hypothetical protein
LLADFLDFLPKYQDIYPQLGLKNSAAFSEIRRDRSGPRLEIGDFLIQNLKFSKIRKKSIKNM